MIFVMTGLPINNLAVKESVWLQLEARSSKFKNYKNNSVLIPIYHTFVSPCIFNHDLFCS